MSWALARAQVASILTTITPSREAQAKFSEAADVDLDGKEVLPDRRFTIFSPTMRVKTPLSSTRMELRSCVVEVHYRTGTDRKRFDLALASDASDIQTALLLTSGWNRPTSTLMSIADDGGAFILDFNVNVDGARTVMTVEFPVLYYA